VHIEAGNTSRGPIVLPDRVVQQLNRIGVALPVPVLPESSQMASNAGRLASSGGVAVATQIPPDGPSASPTDSAEKQSIVRGTPAAAGFDLHPRVAIGRENEAILHDFLPKPARGRASPAWKSLLYIWGSPVFTIVCIYFCWSIGDGCRSTQEAWV